MGLVFERMCQDYIMYHDNKLPIYLGSVGQWWGGHPKTHKQAQIDVVVTAADGNSGIVGSCKFKSAKIGENELLLLQDYGEAMGNFKPRYYYLFSKSGYTDTLKKGAEENVRLITLEDMYEVCGC